MYSVIYKNRLYQGEINNHCNPTIATRIKSNELAQTIQVYIIVKKEEKKEKGANLRDSKLKTMIQQSKLENNKVAKFLIRK